MNLARAQWVIREMPTAPQSNDIGARAVRWAHVGLRICFYVATGYAIYSAFAYSWRTTAVAELLQESFIKMHGSCLMMPDAPAHKFDIQYRWR